MFRISDFKGYSAAERISTEKQKKFFYKFVYKKDEIINLARQVLISA